VNLAVTVTSDRIDVRFLAPAGAEDEETTEEEATGEEAHEEEVPESDLNPIAPELKELAWGFGAFIVLALLMRFLLYPRLHKGVVARNDLIRSGHEEAEQITAAAQDDAAEYESQLASVRGEVARRIDAARATLEQERSERLAEVNARIAERREATAAEVDRAREQARGSVEVAVRDVAAAAGRLATGNEPDQADLAEAVRAAMSAGVAP
jgi:F-type H+-transporting ATPase subunit b